MVRPYGGRSRNTESLSNSVCQLAKLRGIARNCRAGSRAARRGGAKRTLQRAIVGPARERDECRDIIDGAVGFPHAQEQLLGNALLAEPNPGYR